MENSKLSVFLVTGGLGYIGSHVVCKMLNKGYNVLIVDFIENQSVLDRINTISGKYPLFYKMDIRSDKLEIIFEQYNIIGVIHLAGLKSVSESIYHPIEYYDNNVCGTLNLLKMMKIYNVYNLIFSSSATVYGRNIQQKPITEENPIGSGITNPYGETKFMIEKILMDLHKSDGRWKITTLRYFNPVGSHKSHLLGDNPKGIPPNLMPFICRVALQNNGHSEVEKCYESLKIFGADYPTFDGTCVRDFIHISDLSSAHVFALGNFLKQEGHYQVYNVGTGKGISVLELINVFIRVNSEGSIPLKLPYQIVERREGDVGVVFCDNSLIKKELGWIPKKDLVDMCKDAWQFSKLSNLSKLSGLRRPTVDIVN